MSSPNDPCLARPTGRCRRAMQGALFAVAFATAALAPAADLTIEPGVLYFGQTDFGSRTLPAAVTVTNGGAEGRTLGEVSLSGAQGDQYHLEADGCSGESLAPGGRCTLQVSFAPTALGAKTGNLLVPSDDPEAPVLVTFLSNADTVGAEAGRRMPPVLVAANLPDTLLGGSSYGLEWTVVGYHGGITTRAVVFDCTGQTECGANYTDPKLAESAVLDGMTVEDGSVESWSYRGVVSTARRYYWWFTPEWRPEPYNVVVRFYYRSFDDQELGYDSLSLLIPGNLSGLGAGYYDTSGRRLVATVLPSP